MIVDQVITIRHHHHTTKLSLVSKPIGDLLCQIQYRATTKETLVCNDNEYCFIISSVMFSQNDSVRGPLAIEYNTPAHVLT
jgi:hypothetical protein